MDSCTHLIKFVSVIVRFQFSVVIFSSRIHSFLLCRTQPLLLSWGKSAVLNNYCSDVSNTFEGANRPKSGAGHSIIIIVT